MATLLSPSTPSPASALPSLSGFSQQIIDRTVALIQKCYDVPVVLASLKQDSRLYFVGSAGFGAKDAEVDDLPCGETISRNTTVLVPDVASDPAWGFWAGRGMGFYASVPLRGDDGNAIGALSLFDIRARDVEGHGMDVLADYAGLLSALLAGDPALPEVAPAPHVAVPPSSVALVIDLFQDAPSAVVLTDSSNRILAANPALARLLGYSASVLIDQPFFRLVPEVSGEAEKTRYHALLAGERESYQATLALLDSTGGDHPVHMTVSLVRDTEGRPAYAIRMFEETGQRRALLEELRLRDRAIATMPLALAMVDTTSVGQPIVFCNPAFESLTGYRQVDVLGANLLVLRGARTERSALEALDIALRDQVERQAEVTLYRRDGTAFRSRVTQVPVWGEADAMTHTIWLIENQEPIEALREEAEELRGELVRAMACLQEASDTLAEVSGLPPVEERAAAMLERLYDDVPYLEARVVLKDAETEASQPIAAASAGRRVPIDTIDPEGALDRREACRLRVQMESPGEQGAWCLDVPLSTGTGSTAGMLTLYAHPGRLFDDRAVETVRITAARFALPAHRAEASHPPGYRERIAILPEA